MGNDPSSFSTCEITSSFDVANPNPWNLHGGVCKDGTNVSVFLYESEQIQQSVIKNTIRTLKTLKHPGIIKYLSDRDVQNDTWIITESVVPLESVIDTLTPEEVCAGIHSVLQVLAFLHKAGICHNNIGLSSVFVSTDGSWKLGGVDWLCKFTEASPSFLASAVKWRHSKAIAPEEKSSNFVPTVSEGHARDIFAFGHLAEQLLEYMTPLGDLTKTFQISIDDDCLNTDPTQRPQVSALLGDDLFSCDYVDIVDFLKNFTLQSESDREKFFSGLLQRLYMLPPELVANRLTRPLLARFVLLEKSAVEHVVPHLLTPAHGKDRPAEFRPGQINPLFPEYLFKKYVIPELFKIYHVRDCHIRTVLLTHFSKYAKLFGKDLLKSSILPQILLGVRDTNDRLVSLSLRSLADLVDILGGDIVIGVNRQKVFSHGLPKIQTQRIENGVLHNKDVKPVHRKSSEKQTSPQKEERERKRQEARRRMEERKKRRQERKSQEPAPSPRIPSLESDDGGPVDINKVKNSTPEHVSESLATENQQKVEENETGSDMELNDTYKTESDIDLEIEAELEAMETTLTPLKKDKVEAPQEVISVDWSDVQKDSPSRKKDSDISNSKQKVLRLSKRKEKTLSDKSDLIEAEKEEVRVSSQSADDKVESEEDWGEEWEDNDNMAENTGWEEEWTTNRKSPSPKVNTFNSNNKEVPLKSEKVGKGGEKTKEQPSLNKSHATKKQPLGAEFDIMAMDIKTSIREMDYFADMMPDIKPKAGDLYSALGLSDSAGQSQNSKQKSPQKSTVSFAIVETGETTEGGWEVDDWEDS